MHILKPQGCPIRTLCEVFTKCQQKLRADVNADAKVNIKDATAIQKFVAKIETGYPIGKPIQ